MHGKIIFVTLHRLFVWLDVGLCPDGRLIVLAREDGTTFGGVALSEGGAHGYRLGARFALGPDFELGLQGERRESRTERAEHRLMLRGRMRW